MSEEAEDSTGIMLVVVYADPDDYPGKHVARRWWSRVGVVEAEAEPLVVADSLAEVEAVIPEGMALLPPAPDDDPKIVGVWV